MPDDYYVSQYSGEEIDALLASAGAGTVRYDAAQTLTDAQKTQARGNIAAAPDGFGLGDSAQTILTDWNEATENGWWRDGNDNLLNRPFPGRWGIGLTASYEKTFHSVQNAFLIDDGLVYHKIRGRSGRNNWGEWEWVNPPMELGVEYRTTERYLGKPVYVKAVDCGAMPASTNKNIAHGIENICAIVSCTGYFAYGKSVTSLPYARGTVTYVGSIWASETDIVVWADNSDYTNYNAFGIIKYTKTTD